MGIVIDFLIIAGKNVLLGALVRADMVALLRMEFTLSSRISH